MIKIDYSLKPIDLKAKLDKFWQLSGEKVKLIEKEYDHAQGSPVFTVNGKYSTRGWTEWTQGFEFGSSIIQYDITGEDFFLKYGRSHTVQDMATHVSHIGVHDHGFNNISTYGNLLRLMKEGKLPFNEWEKNFYELALKVSGAVQASRWTNTKDGGFIYSFNGPHSLFVDTIRSCRILMLSHRLGHALQADNDVRINLLDRGLKHIKATGDYNVYYGDGRDNYDLWGRTAHEAIFNTNDGNFRCPNAQQGYTGRSTWTRGLAWAMLGFAEELEFLDTITDEELAGLGGRQEIESFILKGALATCDFYIDHTPVCGIPYWDTGGPLLHKLGDYLDRPADPYNDFEPVDSSAAAIGSQALLRLGKYLEPADQEMAKKYFQAGLTVMNSLLDEPYLSTRPEHQGLILHSIYHQPNGWDNVPAGSVVANSESSMWGDYHAREVSLYLQRIIDQGEYYTFFNCVK
jgi:unsaturated chondroitin disaccharide hydrolase